MGLVGWQLGRTRLEVNIKLKANFNAQLFAMNVVVTIPVPDNTANADLQITQGAWCLRTTSSDFLFVKFPPLFSTYSGV
jgi:hypothetical protein